MKTRRCREENYPLGLENKLDKMMKELGAVTLFSGLEIVGEVKYRKSAYFLSGRNIAVSVSCYLGIKPHEYIINFYGSDEEIGKLEQSLENEIGLKEGDRKVNEEEERYKGVLHRLFGHYGGSHNQFYIK